MLRSQGIFILIIRTVEAETPRGDLIDRVGRFAIHWTRVVAIVLLLLPVISSAQAACNISGGTVTCSGASGPLIIPPPDTASVTVMLDSTASVDGITISGLGSSIVDTTITSSGSVIGDISSNNIANFTFVQNGSISGSITANSTGTNTLYVNAGRSVNNVTFDGAINGIDNSGTINTFLNLSASTENYVINRVGGAINTLSLDAPSNTIDNTGTFNSGITFHGAGENTVQNRVGGIINGITSNGTSRDTVINHGQINGQVSLGAGNDTYVNLGRTDPGTVFGSIDMGDGDDIFYMEGGLVTSPVNLGAGNDWAAILDGTLSATFSAGDGNDTLNWAGGAITAGIDMGAGDDRANFYSLTEANLVPGLQVNGGTGTDTMVWQNTTAGGVYRYVNWEAIQLTRGSEMIFSDYSTLTLGDSGTGTGFLSIDGTSKVSAGNGTHTVAPALSGQLVDVYNAGIIDLTNGPATVTDRFVINGNYIGQSGNLNLQTYLGTDNSPSDQLVIRGNGARASGTTVLNITNVNGPGDLTTDNGIRVVDADFAGGAGTDPGSFELGGPVAAGIFEYALYRGGVGADAGDNDWYLRSAAPAPPPPVVPVSPLPIAPPLPPVPTSPLPLPAPPPPEPPAPLPPAPIPITPTVPVTPPPPAPPPIPPSPPEPPPQTGPQIPLIRPEIPGYTIAPAIARGMALAAVNTFHARQGAEYLLTSRGRFPGGWARLLGESADEAWSPSISGLEFQLAPKFDGRILGIQVGHDIWANFNGDGSQDRAGFFYAHTDGSGDAIGYTLATPENNSGNLRLRGENAGVYWTHIDPAGWYIDGVAMATWFNGDATSYRGIGADLSGNALLASLESGYTIGLIGAWSLEPQIQIIGQRIELNDTQDPFSSINYGSYDVWTGRLGMRLQSDFVVNGFPIQPFAHANLWQTFSSQYDVVFNERTVVTGTEGTTLELGAGLSARLTTDVSSYGRISYSTGLAGPDEGNLGGSAGLRFQW